MFRVLRAVKTQLAAVAKTFDPDTLTVAQAADAISLLSAIEKAAAGMRLLLARRIDNESLWGEGGERSAADWLAKQTGQSTSDAARDLECSRRLQELPSAQDAVRNGELSADQTKAVADGATADPSCEDELLDTARRGSLGELARKAKARKAAALGDDEARHAAAHRNRSLQSGTNTEGEQWGRFNGPAADGARLNTYLKPFLDQVFAKARKEGRRERLDAYRYDAMMAAFAAANGVTDWADPPAGATGLAAQGGDGPDTPESPASAASPMPSGPTPPTPTPTPTPPVPAPAPPGAGRANAHLIMRIDAAALLRGHTVAGELCEIDGLGPVSVADLRQYLPDAAISVVVTNGKDVFNVTSIGRHTTAHQQVVMDILNIGCSRLGCSATEKLQVDHRVEWSKIKVTELVNLDWLCPHDHRLKTHDGWLLEPGTGKRSMHPPGQQWWLPTGDAPPGDPPDSHAA